MIVPPSVYGERIADIYDEWVAGREDVLDTQHSLEALSELAGSGPVLELGIGTGRLAVPLANRGLQVHGIEISEEMVRELRAKPGGDQIAVTMGHMADVAVDGPFSLVFAVFTTFFALLSQDEQVRCFTNVARRLTADGVFLIEAIVPDPARFQRGQVLQTKRVEPDLIEVEASLHDAAQQRLVSATVHLTEAGIRIYPVELRYSWPSELDLMARLANLRLLHRWGSWDRSPFTTTSTRHISIYRRAG